MQVLAVAGIIAAFALACAAIYVAGRALPRLDAGGAGQSGHHTPGPATPRGRHQSISGRRRERPVGLVRARGGELGVHGFEFSCVGGEDGECAQLRRGFQGGLATRSAGVEHIAHLLGAPSNDVRHRQRHGPSTSHCSVAFAPQQRWVIERPLRQLPVDGLGAQLGEQLVGPTERT
jgi:hypothetical protein